MESACDSIPTAPRRAAAFQIDVRNCCAPLPKQVREKWKEWESAREANRDITREDVVSRLQRAEKRREEFRLWLTRKPKRVVQVRRRIAEQKAVRAKRLEDKLAFAENKRRLRLEHVRSKAAAMLQRSELVAERVNERQELLEKKHYETLNAAETRRLALIEAEKERLSALHELVFSRLAQAQEKEEQEREETKKQLGAKLVQADITRSAILNAASLKAGEKVRHAKHVSKMRRLNEEKDTELKRTCLLTRLQTAEHRRHEVCTVRSAVNAEKSETQFLKRQAIKREKLRRSGSSRLLQNSWLSFRDSNRTTKDLALAVMNTGLTFLTLHKDEASSDGMTQNTTPTAELKDPFEEFASCLQSEDTINAFKMFLNRMKMKLLGRSKGAHDCSALLKRLYPKTPKNKLERYPTRVFLCAYMILNHPEVVFSQKGEREEALSSSSKDMIESFERLIQRYLEPVGENGQNSQRSSSNDTPSFAELFHAFDDCWVSYLEQFVAWKLHDVVGLEESLIRMATKMELSMLRKVNGDVSSERVQNNTDLKNIVEQVRHDHRLLRERVQRLTGTDGLQKFDQALEATRQNYEAESRDEFPSESNTATDTDTSTNTRKAPSGEPSERGYGGQRGSGNGGRPPRRIPLDNENDGVPVNANKEVFVWELLYDRNFQLVSDTIEEVWSSALAIEDPKMPSLTMQDAQSTPRALQKQIAMIAEKAFWDSVEEKLAAEDGGAAVQVCTMLLEIGQDISATLPNTTSARVVNEYLKNEAELLKLLQGGEQNTNDLKTSGLLLLLEHTSELLRECGSEARNAAAVEAQSKVKENIVRALEGGERGSLAKAVCRALRLLYAQLKVLRFDLANTRIRALSALLTGSKAIQYVQAKFLNTFGLTQGENPIEKLPKMEKWIEEVQQARRSLELVLEPLNADLTNPSRTIIPSSMRSGIRMGSSSNGSLEQWPEVQYISPVIATSWRGTFRIGLIHLVTSPTPLTTQNVPETLHLDVQRLHNVQNSYQRLVVTSAALLTLQQVKQEAIPQEALVDMKRRLAVILENPTVNLSTLTSELAQMADTKEDVETHINNTLINLINREKGGFKALNNGLTKAIGICLIAGDTSSPAIKTSIQSMLSKIGSVFLMEDVLAVAHDLSLIVGINEAVHGQIYQTVL